MNDMDAPSGTYWIKPDREAIYVYCDMDTHGGMWTLVYRYTFRSYYTFNTVTNAVFPRPGWPASDADIQISENSPAFGLGAVDYSLWEYIGGNFLIQSNINDWIFCRPNSGSLVTPINGTIECENIKNIASNCSGFAPKQIVWTSCGPRLFGQNTMYFFDGSSTSCWPIHNPCKETWMDNHEKGVENPTGFIFLRP
ncbi:Hypothetical predicted protein [Paramuricea clavata]|uniref:Uncharacterized protein n=1 Tax=Paramuricea clavata TaxID=317549 RepID=A0A6S7KQN9_PARCT|nr:Hypothetical predicted protein [Paramuricea clavata]